MYDISKAVHIDFHTVSGIYDFGERFDAAECAERLSAAHVNYVNIFAKCNLGFAYYPTELGVPYPNLKGDMFGELLRECHKRGIGVSAYLNVGYDYEMALRHREWRVWSKEINKSDDPILDYFPDMCYYHSGYRRYLVSLVDEINKKYDVDGFFLDCMCLNACYGNECHEAMTAAGIDPADKEAALRFADEARTDFCREVRALVGKDKYLFFNGTPYCNAHGANSHIEIEGLPGGQGYDYFRPQAAYARNIEDKVVYMTARFQKSWADFGGLRTKASLEYDVWDAYMNAVDVSVGDHQHPAESLDPNVYALVGSVYADVMKYEKYTKGARYVPEVGILTASRGIIGKDGRGACRILAELRYNFDIVNEDMDLSRFALLVLPDDIRITEKLAEKLRRHLAAGRGIISSGMSGIDPEGKGFAMEEWGCRFDGEDKSNYSYFKMRDASDEALSDMRWSMYCHGSLVYPEGGAEVIADYYLPYMNRHHDGYRAFWYTPPRQTSDGHAAVVRYGNLAHVCFKLFEAYYVSGMYALKRLAASLIEKLLPEPLVRAPELPDSTGTALTRRGSTTLLHVRATYPELRGEAPVIDGHNSLPAGRRVLVRGRFSSVRLVPEERELSFRQSGAYTEITLPEINGYAMLALEE